jgi:hypothetical protein
MYSYSSGALELPRPGGVVVRFIRQDLDRADMRCNLPICLISAQEATPKDCRSRNSESSVHSAFGVRTVKPF